MWCYRKVVTQREQYDINMRKIAEWKKKTEEQNELMQREARNGSKDSANSISIIRKKSKSSGLGMPTGAMLARRRFESGGSDIKSSIYLSTHDRKSGQLPGSAGSSSGILHTTMTANPGSARYSFAETVEISEEDDSDEDSYDMSVYRKDSSSRNKSSDSVHDIRRMNTGDQTVQYRPTMNHLSIIEEEDVTLIQSSLLET